MTHPLHLARPPGGPTPAVTPSVAGWTYCGLRIVELTPGGSLELTTGSCELVILPLAGACRVGCDGREFELAGRPDVFSRVTDFAYVPRDATVRIESAGGGRFALPSAEARTRREPVHRPAESVAVEVRGRGAATRQVNNFLDPSVPIADRLIAVEVLTPEGSWSSYPPHKHDTPGPGEARLEEIYYFEIARRAPAGHRRVGEGFALQRLYTADRSIDLCAAVAHGDVVLIPRGYHGPSVAPPGYDLYYLNVLAGPAADRTMAFCDDPAHAWVRGAWSGQRADARLPMTSAAGAVVIAPDGSGPGTA